MKSDELLDAIGEAKDEYVQDVRKGKVNKMPGWAKWTSAIAACLVLALGLNIFFNMGGNAGTGGDNDLTYMHYVGPVLPLTVQGDPTGITAARNVDYNFSGYYTYQESYEDANGEPVYYDRYDNKAYVTDSYVIQNESGADKTLTLLYPFIGDLKEWKYYPEFSVNGEAITAVMHPGPYSGGFEGVWGSDEFGTINIKALENFEDYQELLATDAYMNSAFDAFPVLDQKVYVYKLHDYVYSQTTEDVNPFIFIEAKKPVYNEILTYGSTAVDFFVEQLRTGENGLQGYIMAVACADITGIGDKDLGADWGTAQEWLALYDKSDKSTIIPPVIATDYISGKQAKLLSFGYTSDKAGQSAIACGIAPYQGDYSDNNTLVLDGESGQNQILLTPKGASFSQYRIYLPDGTVYDDGTRTLYDSLSLRVMNSGEGICLTAPFQTGEYIYEVELSWPEQGLTVIYGLKIVMTGKESDYDRALDSVFDAYGEGNPLIAVSLVDKYAIGNAVSHSPRYLFKVENIPNAPIWVEVSQTTGEIIAEVDDPDKWLVDPPYVENQTNIPGGNIEGRQMTLADVVELSKLGMELTWENLKEFNGADISSGLYVVRYDIDPEFYLLVGDGKTTGKPMYASLNAVSNGASCDIREGDVETFIEENQSDALDYAIHKAVIEHNADGTFPDFPNGFIPTQVHYIYGIETKSGTPVVGQLNHMEETTVYVHYVYSRYLYTNGELTKAAGNATPAKLTFSVDPEKGYTLKEFWEPNGGNVYAEEIRANFPKEIADIVLDPQSDLVDTDKMEHACLVKVQEYISSLTD